MHRGTIIGIASITMPITSVSMMIRVEEYTPRLKEQEERWK